MRTGSAGKCGEVRGKDYAEGDYGNAGLSTFNFQRLGFGDFCAQELGNIPDGGETTGIELARTVGERGMRDGISLRFHGLIQQRLHPAPELVVRIERA